MTITLFTLLGNEDNSVFGRERSVANSAFNRSTTKLKMGRPATEVTASESQQPLVQQVKSGYTRAREIEFTTFIERIRANIPEPTSEEKEEETEEEEKAQSEPDESEEAPKTIQVNNPVLAYAKSQYQKALQDESKPLTDVEA